MNIKKIFMHEFIMVLFQLFQMVALRRTYFQKLFFFLNFFLFLSGLASVFTELIDWIQYPLFRSPYQYIWTRANDVTKVLL